MGFLTKLAAVNQMLLASGESLVADLQEASGIDTGISEFLLDQASLEYQLRGQADNKVIKTVRPDANGHIFLGYPNSSYAGLVEGQLLSRHLNQDSNIIVARVEQTNPPRLFNLTDNTDVWEDLDYIVEVTNYLVWDQLDTAAQRAVLGTAMRRYQMYTQADASADRLLAESEALFRIKAKANDTSSKRRSIFNNPTSFLAQNRVPYTGIDPNNGRRSSY